ncbi:MAG: phosphoribosylanthranilate isomerase, partial [Candidatus Bathyarchaeia archaeon]
EEDPKEFVSLVRFLGVQYVQLHAPVDPMVLESIRKLAPDLILIKSLIIGRYSWETLLDYARECEILSDAFLTDTFDPKTTAMGATGKTHDWSISARLRNVLKKPLILAGGLTPFNLQMAIEAVHPWGVDVHTGVEDCTGRKVKLLVQQFLHVSQQVFKTIPPYL